MDPTIGSNFIRNALALLVPFTDHRLENLDMSLDFKQNRVRVSCESKIGRLPAARHRSLRDRLPAGVTHADQGFHETCVGDVVDQRRSGRIQTQSKVRAQDRTGARSNVARDARITRLEATDSGTVDANGPSHCCLRDAGTEPEEAELVAESSGAPCELAVAFVKGPADPRH